MGMLTVLWTLAISLSAHGGQQQRSLNPALILRSVQTKQAMKRIMLQARIKIMFRVANALNHFIEGNGLMAPRAKATAEQRRVTWTETPAVAMSFPMAALMVKEGSRNMMIS